MTVTKLLTGKDAPISNLEFTYWAAYLSEKNRREEEASDPKKNKKQAQTAPEYKRTMGAR